MEIHLWLRWCCFVIDVALSIVSDDKVYTCNLLPLLFSVIHPKILKMNTLDKKMNFSGTFGIFVIQYC